MKLDFPVSMYVQLATTHAITTGQRNATFRLLKGDMLKKVHVFTFKVYMKRNFRQQFYCPP